MSIPVSLEHLRDEIGRASTPPFLITVGSDSRPHCVVVTLGWEADVLVAAVGDRTIANATARPLVSLVWPANRPGEHTLIVDATATASAGPTRRILLTPTSAVLHRGATPADDRTE